MTTPENTSRRSPAAHTLGALAAGDAATYITGMEAAGQRQLVNSDRMPTQRAGDPAEWAALGFTFGDPDPNDPLFCPATLPPGWTREGTDHNMHSCIVDERGLRRVGVFYKAADYDRRADAHLFNVGYEAASQAIYGDGPVVVPWAKLTEEETAAVKAAAENYLVRAGENPGIYGDRAPRARAVLEAGGRVSATPDTQTDPVRLGLATIAARYEDLGQADAAAVTAAILRRPSTPDDLANLANLADVHAELDVRARGGHDPQWDADFGGPAKAGAYWTAEYDRLLGVLADGVR